MPAFLDSTKVAQQFTDFYDSDAAPAIVLFESDQKLTNEQNAYLESLPQKFEDIGVTFDQASPVNPSEGGRSAQIVVPLTDSDAIAEHVKLLSNEIDNAPDGLLGYVTGPAGFASELTEAFAGIDGPLLIVALVVVFVILLIVYRSPILPIIVLLSSMVALSGAIFVVWHIADAGWVKTNGQVQGILLILVVGAATDYALLYVARYREALISHQNRFAATTAAIRGSIEPILASGSTVIAGLLCLFLSELASNKALGPVAATGIVLAMLASLTFLPAALAWGGRTVFWPARPVFDAHAAEHGVEEENEAYS